MKFKKGDRVRIKKGTEYESQNSRIGNGKIKTVISFDPDGWTSLDFENYYRNSWPTTDLEVVSKGKKVKSKPTQFVAFYEVNKVDPMKEFEDKRGLMKWLKEAKADTSIDFSSIKVFEVKKEFEILTSFRLKKK